jgi:hypothetical protein
MVIRDLLNMATSFLRKRNKNSDLKICYIRKLRGFSPPGETAGHNDPESTDPTGSVYTICSDTYYTVTKMTVDWF